ncbi:MAG: HlyC/CorC family transporter [Roseburia sp.]|nr:HlyC/CorC family transporter [Roseburia sp.]
MLQPIILLVILIFVNAAFASAEIAVISMSEPRLKLLAEEGNRRAKKLLYLTDQPARFLATIQVAITLAGLLQSAFAAENFAGPLVAFLIGLGVTVPETALKTVCIVVITLILAYFNLVFGELVPKRIAMKKTEQMALGMAGILYLVARIFAPLVWLLTISTNGILRLLGMNPEEEEQAVSEEEIRMLLAEGKEQGTIPSEETEMIQNVFGFDDVAVGDICTHRKEVVSLSTMEAEHDWEKILAESAHTYYPIFEGRKEEIVGILDAKAYFRMKERTKECVMRNAVQPPMFVPETMKANVLFEQMKQKQNYFAVVVDEFGGIAGVVTLCDIMEYLVGDLDEVATA